ncbi:DUF2269 family protein [Rhodococcus sp. X156]|uniref:DUF2269 family protein n=1 Tax=Rhodococcus sp. X156 TaxID=2499145 RepID=UPI000FD75B48|nr:DUF2269 family protein [Rhodococcus sp. X156]
MEDVLNVLHVVTGVFIVGPMAILPHTALRAVRNGDAAQVRSLAQSTNIMTLASVLVVIFGFGLVSVVDYDLSFTTPWILISIILYVIALVLSLVMVVPALQKAADTLQPAGVAATAGSEATAPRGGSPDYGRIAMSSGIVSLLLVAIVVLMVVKPG